MEQFIKIEKWMTDEQYDMTTAELLVFAIIYGFTRKAEGKCVASAEYIAQWARLRPRQVYNVLHCLETKGYISKRSVRINNTNRCEYVATLDHHAKITECSDTILQKLHNETAKIAECNMQNLHDAHTAKFACNINSNSSRIEEKDSVCVIDTREMEHTHTQEKQVSPKPQCHSDDMEERENCAKEKELDLSIPLHGMEWETGDYFFLDGRYAPKRFHQDWKRLVERQKKAKKDFTRLFAKKYSLLGKHPCPLTWEEYQICLHDWGRQETESLLMQLDAKSGNLKYDTIIKGLRIYHQCAKN